MEHRSPGGLSPRPRTQRSRAASSARTSSRPSASKPPGRLDPLPGGPPACVWEDSAFTQQISVAFLPNRDYLVDTYRVRAMYRVFEPVTIAGLPAVAQKTTPETLTCTVTIGIAIGQAVDVNAKRSRRRSRCALTACDKAVRTSELVLTNLPEQPPK